MPVVDNSCLCLATCLAQAENENRHNVLIINKKVPGGWHGIASEWQNSACGYQRIVNRRATLPGTGSALFQELVYGEEDALARAGDDQVVLVIGSGHHGPVDTAVGIGEI